MRAITEIKSYKMRGRDLLTVAGNESEIEVVISCIEQLLGEKKPAWIKLVPDHQALDLRKKRPE